MHGQLCHDASLAQGERMEIHNTIDCWQMASLMSHLVLQVNITRYALDAITNTELLASADLFIGSAASRCRRILIAIRALTCGQEPSARTCHVWPTSWRLLVEAGSLIRPSR